MPTVYSTARLEADGIDQAFVLVAALAPNITSANWRDFVRQVDGHRIALLRDGEGYSRGICIYAIVQENGMVTLEALLFAALSAVDRRGIAGAMLEFLKSEARQAGSRMIHFRTLSATALADYLRGELPATVDGVRMLVG
jgi:hypothetical protein